MHLCLEISEIVDRITGYVKDSSGTPGVAALARTSRTLLEPALDVLWCEQLGLDNLIKSLPAEAWRVEGTTSNSPGDLSLVRSLRYSDWERFNYYAKRIKNITFKEQGLRWGPDVSTALGIHQGTLRGDMLPSLRSVTWRLDRNTNWHHSYYFLSRALVSISITGDGWGAEGWLAALLSYLPHSSPDVERIEILCTFGPLSTDIFDPITRCAGLRFLKCTCNIPWKTILQLVQLPKIENLWLSPSQALESPPSQIVSQSLISLSISRNVLVNSTSAGIVLQHCKFPALKAFTSNFCSDERPYAITTALRHCCTPDLLSSFTLWDRSPIWGFQRFNLQDIRPLFEFHNLTDVGLHTGSHFGDDGVEQMARAWPRLQKLCLGSSTPSFTLLGLVPLVQHCQDLDTLRIELDGRRVPMPLNHRPGNGYSNLGIRTVALGTSEVDECPKVAAFLSDLFPNLRKIECAELSPFKPSYKGGWERVEGLLEVFAAVRMQERGGTV